VHSENAHFWQMNFLQERSYNMMKANPSFMSIVANLHSDSFVQHRGSYVEQAIMEFYAGIQDSKGGKSLYHYVVRGRKVFFKPKMINNHYMLTYNGRDFEENFETYIL